MPHYGALTSPDTFLAYQFFDAFDHRIDEEDEQDRAEGEDPGHSTGVNLLVVYFSCLHEGRNGLR